MFILRLFVKMMLIPVWLVLAMLGMLSSLAVGLAGIVKGIISFILTALLLGTVFIYHDWLQAGFLLVLMFLSFLIPFTGVSIEVLIETVRDRVKNQIIG